MKRPSAENIECAELILRRNRLNSDSWRGLRDDIARTIDLAEKLARKEKLNEQAK